MSNLSKQIKSLFDMCEKANIALKFVDRYNQSLLLHQIEEQSNTVFLMLENLVNPMNFKDFLKNKDIEDRKMILKLYFVIMKSLCICKRMGITKFEGERSRGSAMLAYKLLFEHGFENKFGQSQTWINNNIIYTNGIVKSIGKVHPTLVQKIVRCLTMTLRYPEIQEQPVPDYMKNFEQYIFYYLVNGPHEERIYLDYI